MPSPTITRRILVPLDGGKLSISALPFLRALATPESEIVLLRVVPDAKPLLNRLSGAGSNPDEVLRRSIDSCETFLAEVRESLRRVTTHIRTLTRVGHPADEIVNVSEDLGMDLIMMATNGHGQVGRLVLGSVADRVARSAVMPVMLFRPHPLMVPLNEGVDVQIDRVVVPIDGSVRARAAFPAAIELATQFAAPIHLIRVIALEDHLDLGASALENEYGALLDEASRLRDTITFEMEEDALSLREHGRETSVDVRIGSAARSIMDALEPGDLVVMTSHGEGGVRRWLVGSVAEKLIQQSVAPLVIIPSAERAAISASIRSASAPV